MKLTKAMVNSEVKTYLTPLGVKKWWIRPAWQLDGLTPFDAWEEGRKQDVYAYAQGGRDMVAT